MRNIVKSLLVDWVEQYGGTNAKGAITLVPSAPIELSALDQQQIVVGAQSLGEELRRVVSIEPSIQLETRCAQFELEEFSCLAELQQNRLLAIKVFDINGHAMHEQMPSLAAHLGEVVGVDVCLSLTDRPFIHPVLVWRGGNSEFEYVGLDCEVRCCSRLGALGPFRSPFEIVDTLDWFDGVLKAQARCRICSRSWVVERITRIVSCTTEDLFWAAPITDSASEKIPTLILTTIPGSLTTKSRVVDSWTGEFLRANLSSIVAKAEKRRSWPEKIAMLDETTLG